MLHNLRITSDFFTTSRTGFIKDYAPTLHVRIMQKLCCRFMLRNGTNSPTDLQRSQLHNMCTSTQMKVDNTAGGHHQNHHQQPTLNTGSLLKNVEQPPGRRTMSQQQLLQTCSPSHSWRGVRVPAAQRDDLASGHTPDVPQHRPKHRAQR